MEFENSVSKKVRRIAHLRSEKRVEGLDPPLESELRVLIETATRSEIDQATLLIKRSEACGD